MQQNPAAQQKRRAQTLMLILAFFFALLVGQFFRLQVLQAKKWRSAASKQHTLIIDEPAPRGRFLSNTAIRWDHPLPSKELVVDIPKFHLHIDPLSLPPINHGPIAEHLIKLLPRHVLEKGDLRSHLLSQMRKRARDRVAAKWIEPSERNAIEAWWLDYHLSMRIPRNALFFVPDYQRTYPQGPMLSQVLQTVRHERKEDKSAIPIGGLELFCDRALTGVNGKRRLLRSLKNPMETAVVLSPSIPGSDVFLTINHILQAIAEDELQKGVNRCGAKGGWALLMNCHTGEILSLAHVPAYNPQQYGDYFNSEKEYISQPRALCEAHELGSVIKPLHIAIALAANEELQRRGAARLFDPEEKIAVRPCRFPGRAEMRDVAIRRYCSLDLAVQKSSNVYMAHLVHRIGERLGFKWYRDRLLSMGFRGLTGVEIRGEASAHLPPLEGSSAGRWSASTPTSLCLGHSLQLNALHLARAYSALANGGYLVKPHLIKNIGSSQKKGPGLSDVRSEQILSQKVCDRVLKSMAFVTQTGGTGHRAAVAGYGIFGKTGTAEKVIDGRYSKKKMISTFIGIAPQLNPSFVLLVSIDEPAYGYRENIGLNHRAGTCAAPVFGQIAKRSLQYLCVPKDYGDHQQDNQQTNGLLCEQNRKKKLMELQKIDVLWNKN